jgi:predicted Fe-S protein YdhL (DUF1289 family)
MKKTAFAILLAAAAAASTPVFAQDYTDNDTPMLSPAETAQLRAQRDAARAEWARMTPEQRAAVKQAARQKRFDELTALDMVSDNDTVGLTSAELADLRAQMAAAKAKWNALSPAEKAAMKKQDRQMQLVDMTMLQKVAGSGS